MESQHMITSPHLLHTIQCCGKYKAVYTFKRDGNEMGGGGVCFGGKFAPSIQLYHWREATYQPSLTGILWNVAVPGTLLTLTYEVYTQSVPDRSNYLIVLDVPINAWIIQYNIVYVPPIVAPNSNHSGSTEDFCPPLYTLL